jgi:hypothetical protein
MYKKRIQDWQLDKKLKEDDVLQILRIITLRGRSRPAVIFQARGKVVEDDHIRRYVARNPKVMERFQRGEIPAGDSIRTVTYQEVQSARFWSPGVNTDPTERLLSSMRLYIAGSFDSGAWQFDPTGCWSRESTPASEVKLHDYWHQCFLDSIAAMAHKAEPEVVGQALNQVFHSLGLAVKQHPPYFLPAFLGMLFHTLMLEDNQLLKMLGQNQLLKMMVQHALELAVIYLGKHHGLSLVLEHLNSSIEAQVAEYGAWFFERPAKLLLSNFDDLTGPSNVMTIFMLEEWGTVIGLNEGYSTSYASHIKVITPFFEDQILSPSLAVVEKYMFQLIRHPRIDAPRSGFLLYFDKWDLDDRDIICPRLRQTLLSAFGDGIPPGPQLSGDGVPLGPQASHNCNQKTPDGIDAGELAKRHFNFGIALRQLSHRGQVLVNDWLLNLANSVNSPERKPGFDCLQRFMADFESEIPHGD